MAIAYPKLSKLPLMVDSVAKKITIGTNAKIVGTRDDLNNDGDIIEIDGMLYHCHPAVSNLLNSLWEQIEGMKESIDKIENAKN